jgi:hypothetical protein
MYAYASLSICYSRFIRPEIPTLVPEPPSGDVVNWALLASDRDGRLEFAGPAILNPPRQERAI